MDQTGSLGYVVRVLFQAVQTIDHKTNINTSLQGTNMKYETNVFKL